MWDLKASDYRYLSQMLIFALGTGDDTFFIPEVTTRLRKVLLQCRKIGHMLWHPGRWSKARLQMLESTLKSFGEDFKELFKDVSAGEKEDDKSGFIKLHALMHIVEDIRRFGSPFNYSLESWERSHQEFVKQVFIRTNASKEGIKTEEAMLREVLRRELLYQALRIAEDFTIDDLNIITNESKDASKKKLGDESRSGSHFPWRTSEIVIPAARSLSTSTSVSFTYNLEGAECVLVFTNVFALV